MRQEVIIYRNPAEAALWDFIMSAFGSHMAVWIVCAFVVFGLLHLNTNILRRLPNWLLNPWAIVSIGLALTHSLFLLVIKFIAYL